MPQSVKFQVDGLSPSECGKTSAAFKPTSSLLSKRRPANPIRLAPDCSDLQSSCNTIETSPQNRATHQCLVRTRNMVPQNSACHTPGRLSRIFRDIPSQATGPRRLVEIRPRRLRARLLKGRFAVAPAAVGGGGNAPSDASETPSLCLSVQLPLGCPFRTTNKTEAPFPKSEPSCCFPLFSLFHKQKKKVCFAINDHDLSCWFPPVSPTPKQVVLRFFAKPKRHRCR